MAADNMVIVENVNIPGQTNRVNAHKYNAMKEAYLRMLPKGAPGMTQQESILSITEYLPEDIFPGGKTAGWWLKTVQLDLEAKGVVKRENTKPLRWYQI